MKTAAGTKPPNLLYKYRQVDIHLIRMLVMGEVYFSNPMLDFNDPYDTRMDLLGKKHTGRTILGVFREDISHRYSGHIVFSGLCCLSEKRDDILMFSHYADAHKGVCVGFNTEQFEECAIGHNKSKAVLGGGAPFWVKVQYVDNLNELLQSKDPDLMRSLLWTKAASWQYEKEWRLVDPSGSGPIRLIDGTIAELVLGCNISEDNKALVLALMERFHPRATINQAHMADSAFRIDVTKINAIDTP